MIHFYRRFGLLCVMLGASVVLTVTLDPYMGVGHVLLVAGVMLLRERYTK